MRGGFKALDEIGPERERDSAEATQPEGLEEKRWLSLQRGSWGGCDFHSKTRISGNLHTELGNVPL